ncbi:hypothetical protein BJ138DRAFT_1200314, partial [Hygrophoropsis aurantiaca]
LLHLLSARGFTKERPTRIPPLQRRQSADPLRTRTPRPSAYHPLARIQRKIVSISCPFNTGGLTEGALTASHRNALAEKLLSDASNPPRAHAPYTVLVEGRHSGSPPPSMRTIGRRDNRSMTYAPGGSGISDSQTVIPTEDTGRFKNSEQIGVAHPSTADHPMTSDEYNDNGSDHQGYPDPDPRIGGPGIGMVPYAGQSASLDPMITESRSVAPVRHAETERPPSENSGLLPGTVPMSASPPSHSFGHQSGDLEMSPPNSYPPGSHRLPSILNANLNSTLNDIPEPEPFAATGHPHDALTSHASPVNPSTSPRGMEIDPEPPNTPNHIQTPRRSVVPRHLTGGFTPGPINSPLANLQITWKHAVRECLEDFEPVIVDAIMLRIPPVVQSIVEQVVTSAPSLACDPPRGGNTDDSNEDDNPHITVRRRKKVHPHGDANFLHGAFRRYLKEKGVIAAARGQYLPLSTADPAAVRMFQENNVGGPDITAIQIDWSGCFSSQWNTVTVAPIFLYLIFTSLKPLNFFGLSSLAMLRSTTASLFLLYSSIISP